MNKSSKLHKRRSTILEDSPYKPQEAKRAYPLPVKTCVQSIRKMFCLYGVTDKQICAYLVPNNNEHMSEYLSDHDQRLKFLCGFSGPGTALITDNDAILWTDTRYYYQARKQVGKEWKVMNSSSVNEAEWIKEHLERRSRVGCNPKLLPYPIWISLKEELLKCKIKLIPITPDFVETLWTDRPEMPCFPLETMPEEFSGMASVDKVEEVRLKMREKQADMLVITALDDIAWLFNLRGSDIPYNPVFFSFAAITLKFAYLFFDEKKSHLKIRNHIKKESAGSLGIHPYIKFYPFVKKIIETKGIQKVWVPSITNYYLYSLLPNEKCIMESSPVQNLKAVKNDVEAEGMANASIRDGVALCQFFHWLEDEIRHSALTESDAVKKLEKFRFLEEHYVGMSFPTNSSTGSHTAIPHYIPDEESDRLLSIDEIYLCDTGCHYKDGTTDITRTFHFGEPSEFQKICYTRVFKGFAQLSTVVFPSTIKGDTLDCLCRYFLWEIGLDFGHGSGHGVGCFLNTHEGPGGISWRPYPDDPGLEERMFLSIEPGYYCEQDFGVKIENVVQVVAAETKYNQDTPFLTFSTVTKCPIQTKMLIEELLEEDELKFLNEYNKDVLDTLGPILQKRGLLHAYEWLVKETAHFGKFTPEEDNTPHEEEEGAVAENKDKINKT